MPSEFDLIRRHFSPPTTHTDLAGGDDGALVRVAAGMQLVVSTDMLVAGTHFFPNTDPESLGWKALAVNISDLAAMAATPRWATLALSLPVPEEAWIAAFARGFLACAEAFGVDLIGGDTTRGPLNLCPTVFGEVPTGHAVTRAGARPGDELWISGQPGRAALALTALQGAPALAEPYAADCHAALLRPQPRLALGLALGGVASAMLDVSDGLLGDLGHILECSGVGARLTAETLPLQPLLAACGEPARALQALLHGGDDYELLFTAPPHHRATLQGISIRLGLALHPIGTITPRSGCLSLMNQAGEETTLAATGYDHFAKIGSPPGPDNTC
ncbi:MAG: thiamine-phosphate kinase [Rhodocyclaceae bacterium]|jgi:thiamine-monophosphate kinase|nr:thiamine-phosphate kinase [Rhodocyclaceae bacterium]